MKNREQILMQKIAKREKVKKKLNEKAAKTKTAENGRENNSTACLFKFNNFSNFSSADNQKNVSPKVEKGKKQKLIEKPEQKIKKKKKKQQKVVEKPESDEEGDEPMEESDGEEEETNGNRKNLQKSLVVC
jgi:hypothetical protein